jgi:hypothetical protein
MSETSWAVYCEGEKVVSFDSEREARKYARYLNAEFATDGQVYCAEPMR